MKILPEISGRDKWEVEDFDDETYGDWPSAFREANRNIAGAIPGQEISLDPFKRKDVVKVFACFIGENDEEDWLATVQLKDGRFAHIEAGCDYTGWD